MESELRAPEKTGGKTNVYPIKSIGLHHPIGAAMALGLGIGHRSMNHYAMPKAGW